MLKKKSIDRVKNRGSNLSVSEILNFIQVVGIGALIWWLPEAIKGVLQKSIPWLPFWSAGKLIFYVNLEEKIASLPGIQFPSQPGKPEFGALCGSGGDD